MQVTADGVPVLWHDDYVVHGSLCAPKRSLVSQLTLSELRSLKLFLRWFKDAGTHAVMPCDHEWHCQAEDIIPTLAEAFEQLPEVRFASLCDGKSACVPSLEQHNAVCSMSIVR